MIINKLLLSASIIAILVFSTVFVATPITPRASAQQKVPGANWEYTNFDSHATGFSPQTQITKDSVKFLELKWLYPLPPASVAAAAVDYAGGLFNFPAQEASLTPPIIVDGIVYFMANYFRLFALNAENGKTIWTYQYSGNVTAARTRLPLAGGIGHFHGIHHIDGNILFFGLECDVIAVNALTGKESWKIKDYCANIPGNGGFYTGGFQSNPPVVHRGTNTLIFSSGVVDGFTGRGFIAGYDLNTKALKWRFFLTPPAGGDPDWAVRVRDKIWIQGVKGTDIPADLLKNDWGDLGTIRITGPSPLAAGRVIDQVIPRSGAGTVWGQMSVDEDTGIVYAGISQPSPDANATFRPGPNLFTDAVIAINARNGELVWAHQTTTHDLWDWDCSWNTILGNIGSRKVIFKACKNGIVYAFDAANGQIIWSYNAPTIKRTNLTPFHPNSKLGNGPTDSSLVAGWDPRNPNTFKHNWYTFPTLPNQSPQHPGFTGSIESDISWDGESIFVGTYNNWGGVSNTTLYAIDATTGQPKWNIFFDGVGFRGGVSVTRDMVLLPSGDGNLYFIDKKNGAIVDKRFLGIGVWVMPTVGATSSGKINIFQMIGGRGFGAAGGVGQPVPGALMAFGLPDKIPEPQVITKEVVKEVTKEVPKEVVKEVVKEVPKEVIKEVVKEVPKEIVREVVKEVPKEVIKEVPKTVTVETIGPVTYAAIGVAVVAMVVAGVALSRRKKA